MAIPSSLSSSTSLASWGLVNRSIQLNFLDFSAPGDVTHGKKVHVRIHHKDLLEPSWGCEVCWGLQVDLGSSSHCTCMKNLPDRLSRWRASPTSSPPPTQGQPASSAETFARCSPVSSSHYHGTKLGQPSLNETENRSEVVESGSVTGPSSQLCSWRRFSDFSREDRGRWQSYGLSYG